MSQPNHLHSPATLAGTMQRTGGRRDLQTRSRTQANREGLMSVVNLVTEGGSVRSVGVVISAEFPAAVESQQLNTV